MLSKVLNFFLGGRTLPSALRPEKVVKLHGIKFKIRKLNPLDYMSGAQILHKTADVYSRAPEGQIQLTQSSIDKIKEHYRETLLAGIVSAKILGVEMKPVRSKTDEADSILVDHFMTDWDLAEEIYASIVEFTYGKKKLKSLASQKKN